MFAARKTGELCASDDGKAWAFCMVGGIHQVAATSPIKIELQMRLTRAARQLFPDFQEPFGLMTFNDTKGRTHADVLRVIDHAITTL
jgi:hypothetical protein